VFPPDERTREWFELQDRAVAILEEIRASVRPNKSA